MGGEEWIIDWLLSITDVLNLSRRPLHENCTARNEGLPIIDRLSALFAKKPLCIFSTSKVVHWTFSVDQSSQRTTTKPTHINSRRRIGRASVNPTFPLYYHSTVLLLLVRPDYVPSRKQFIQYTTLIIMKSILFFLTLLVSAAAFAPQMFGVRESNTWVEIRLFGPARHECCGGCTFFRSFVIPFVDHSFDYFHSVCFAKHCQDKAAKWAKAKRPRKSRPSDINRKPIIYEIHTMTKPAEYSISDAPASPMAKPTPAGN